jgi:cytosine/adenosine deaminase-related metal-dependent hydrolase
MAIDHIEDDSSIVLEDVRIAGKTSTSCSIHCRNGLIESINTDASSSASHTTPPHRLLVPGLCHPHIHLDKCFLLSHPKYKDLEIKEGDFAEAMKITSRPFTLSSGRGCIRSSFTSFISGSEANRV